MAVHPGVASASVTDSPLLDGDEDTVTQDPVCFSRCAGLPSSRSWIYLFFFLQTEWWCPSKSQKWHPLALLQISRQALPRQGSQGSSFSWHTLSRNVPTYHISGILCLSWGGTVFFSSSCNLYNDALPRDNWNISSCQCPWVPPFSLPWDPLGSSYHLWNLSMVVPDT